MFWDTMIRTAIRKPGLLFSIDPNDILWMMPVSWPSFWDSGRLGANRHADWYSIPELGPTVRAWLMRPSDNFCRALTAIWSFSWYGRLAGQCSGTLIKQGIADLFTVTGCRDDISGLPHAQRLGS